ncbi:MAG: sigma-70 family RNA polymerase sigma factor [Sorangiineae bacterium PRO1]|nr:sigma-70 family RNA polymerase sigma factor [Sorangiineae bacterium PRO1]
MSSRGPSALPSGPLSSSPVRARPMPPLSTNGLGGSTGGTRCSQVGVSWGEVGMGRALGFGAGASARFERCARFSMASSSASTSSPSPGVSSSSGGGAFHTTHARWASQATRIERGASVTERRMSLMRALSSSACPGLRRAQARSTSLARAGAQMLVIAKIVAILAQRCTGQGSRRKRRLKRPRSRGGPASTNIDEGGLVSQPDPTLLPASLELPLLAPPPLDRISDPPAERVSGEIPGNLLQLLYRQMRGLAGPRPDLDDLVQAAAERALKSWSRFEGRSALST